jgi:eukaryotic-like serine/threonine-protein kinase
MIDASAHWSMIGATVGCYRVLAPLGRGGMGEVYRAEDLRLQRHVALKVLPPDGLADDQKRRRFLQEARAASALNDPHIVTVHDIFTADGTDFLVMELVNGRTLRQIVDAGPVAIADVLGWGAQIADGLAVAHAAGIVHRDLKPGNVMLTDRGVVKILDFGIAKVRPTDVSEPTAGLTLAGDVIGTVDYMSPEQARGDEIDHRSDIFSLGAVLYELLTGRRPFSGEHIVAVLHKILYGLPTPLRDLRPEVPPDVEAIVASALARDRDQRYQTMEQLATALRAALQTSAAVPARATAWPEPALAPTQVTRSVPRHVWWPRAAALAAAALLVLWLAAPYTYRWLRAGAAGGDAAVASIAAMPLATEVARPATALEHTQQGLGLLRRFDRTGHVEQAIETFESAIALDARYAPAWAGLARAYWRQQRVTRDWAWGARAQDAAQHAVSLDPSLADGHVSLGLAALSAGDLPMARSTLEHALVLNPGNADAHRGLGDLTKAEDRLDAAAVHYARAVELAPADWELPRLAGDIPYMAGRYDEALAWYERAAVAVPDSAVPYRLLGAAHHMLGDYAAAASALQQSISLQPNASAYTNLGTALFYQGKYREALPAFERAVELMPSAPIMWANLGDAYRWVPGNQAPSMEAYQRALQLLRTQLAADPTHVANRSNLALYLAKTGQTAEALEELARVPADASEVNSLYRGAVTYELAGRRDDALRMLDAALERGYSLLEVAADPELADLRSDVRYHRLAVRFERRTAPVR